MKRTDGLRLAATIGVLALASTGRAHETDQFTVPVDKEFADVGSVVTAEVYDTIERALNHLNSRLEKVYQGTGSDRLEYLGDPDTLADEVFAQFKPAFVLIEYFDHLAHHDAAFARLYPGRLTGHWESIRNIYKNAYFPLDPRQFWRLWHAATMKIHGVYFGPDKLGHFSDMGFFYYLVYRKALGDGATEQQALQRALDEGRHGLLLGERGMLGYGSAGAYSNADMASNYVGMKFYLNLTQPTRLKGELRPPLVEWDGRFWRFSPHVRRDSDFFAWFISDHYNEALNPSLWEKRARKTIRKAVSERGSRILEFYADDNGNRRPPAYFKRLREELSTYYGEDYGYEGSAGELITIGDTCYGEPPSDDAPDARNERGYGALHWAAMAGDTQRATRLLAAGATVDLPARSLEQRCSEWGTTPLHLAAEAGAADLVRLLLDNGAAVNRANDRGATPLHRAIGHPDVVELLLERGADPDARDVRGRTPLHWLARYPEPRCAELLLAAGADVEAADHDGTTPVHRAARWGHTGLVAALLDAGADPRARARFDTTPLHFAARAGQGAVVELLAAHGAGVGAADAFGLTPLHEAALSGRIGAIEALAGAGAAPDARDASHSTPLHLAARGGYETAAALLLEAGAPINAVNDAGSVPLHEAAMTGRLPLVNLLLARGADAAAQDTNGRAADQVASARGHVVAALVLSSYRAAHRAPSMGGR